MNALAAFIERRFKAILLIVLLVITAGLGRNLWVIAASGEVYALRRRNSRWISVEDDPFGFWLAIPAPASYFAFFLLLTVVACVWLREKD